MDAKTIQSEVYRTRSKYALAVQHRPDEEVAEALREMDEAVLRKILLTNIDKVRNVGPERIIELIDDIEEQ